MNDHEAERIAAAMHELRPDWPSRSLLTLIRKNLLDKPRRDVAIALTWVACESGTHTPARVLEAGPWWRATAADSPSDARRYHDRGPWCANCGTGEDSVTHRTGECTFTIRPAAKPAPEVLHERVAAIKAELQPGPQIQPPPETPDRCGDHGCVRAHGHTGPHQGPPEVAGEDSENEGAA